MTDITDTNKTQKPSALHALGLKKESKKQAELSQAQPMLYSALIFSNKSVSYSIYLIFLEDSTVNLR